MEAIKPNKKLRNARREHSWTQAQLAEELAVGTSTVRSWESGTRSPLLIYRSRLCTLFQMTPEELGFVTPLVEQELDPIDHGIALNRQIEKNGPQEEFREPFPLSLVSYHSAEHHDNENRHRMLNRVQSRCISGFLDHMSSDTLISLYLLPRPDAVDSLWRTRNQEPYISTLQVPDNKNIVEVYDEADGELLILGELGAGKTTLLLELTQELVERCRLDEMFPIPVIFHLSGWAEKKAPLTDWLAEELNLKYQVPFRIAQKWIASDQVLPLLDGLDEVGQASRPACVEAINTYRQEHGFIPMVVCCRTSDYDSLREKLVLGMAIVVQPLTFQQIDYYISKSSKDLATMRIALQTDPSLQEIVSTPLMLSILAYSLQGMSQEDVKMLQSSHSVVLEQYVERLLRKEAKQHSRYTPEQTKQWLSWLAWQMVQQNQTEFYIERMQPDWIENNQQRHQYQRTVIRIVMIIHCIVSGVLVAWLKGGLKNGIVGSGNGILGLFGGGAGNSMMGWMSPGIGGGSQGGASLVIILGIVIWLVTILVGSSSLPVITPRAIRHGLLSGLLAGLKLGVPVSVLGILFFTLSGGLQHGISYGLGIGFFLGILVGLMRGLGVGLRNEQQTITEKASFSDRLIDGLILGVGAGLSFMVVEVLLQVSYKSTLIYSCVVVLFFFFAYGFGGGTNLFSSLAQTIKPAEMVTWSWVHMTQDMGKNSSKSLIVTLITSLSVSGVIASISSLFFSNIGYGIHYGLVFGSISGLIVGIAAILTSMLQSGWSSNMLPEDQHTKPNEGISRSGRNALLGACFFAPIGGIASGLACAVGFGLIGQLPKWSVMGLAFAVMLTIIFFVIFTFAHGGSAWIEHYVLRRYLWRAGSMPANYVRFLNSASEYALIRKVGGGYMFTHRLVQEHFARMYQSSHNDHS
ncbi:MAG: NACHT domain-containing protein [Ktedonobacteraceae bacterium]|nr:NACHT domain-containing protein [Ktedonobacteraceae bacterium]